MSKLNVTPKPSQPKIEDKFIQLSLNFEADFSLGPILCEDKTDSMSKVFIPMELIKHPFFFPSQSKLVSNSRIGFKFYKMFLALKKKGVSQEEIKKQTTYETSPSYTLTEISEESDTTDPLVVQLNDWIITSHQNYGLPSDFDAHVWNFIVNKISDVHQQHDKFYSVYFFTISEISNYFKNIGFRTSKGGSFYADIKFSLERLLFTKYSSVKGLFRKDTNSFVETSQYSFSLLSNLFVKGDRLSDGTTTDRFAVTIDPLLIRNFNYKYFLISFHQKRKLVKMPQSIALFDKLSYLCYAGIKSGDFNYAKEYDIKPFSLLNYLNVCEFLGLEPLPTKKFFSSQLSIQFDKVHNELIRSNVLENVYFDQRIKDGKKSFNVVYVFTGEFIENILSFASRDLADFYGNFEQNIKQADFYFKKISSLIKSEEIRKQLGMVKTMDEFQIKESAELINDTNN